MGKMLGYARTSTGDQIAGLKDQIDRLKDAGCARVYEEHASAVGDRPEFDRLMDRLEAGDQITVTKMDRLARNVRHLLEIVDTIGAKGATLRILDFNGETVDTKSSTGRLMLQMFAAFAEFERNVMLERQRPGIEAAKADGKYKGRKPTAMAKADKIRAMDTEGMTRVAIAAALGVSERSVYRALGK